MKTTLTKERWDIVIVGAGISGATLAERYAQNKEIKILVIEQRNHIGGNCYDQDNESGIRISKYGPHYFRTNDEGVWQYVQKFSDWVPFEAKVLSHVDSKKVPMPINMDTVNIIFNAGIKDESDMEKWLDKEVEKIEIPQNSEESALKRAGKRLYEKMLKNYTTKQ